MYNTKKRSLASIVGSRLWLVVSGQGTNLLGDGCVLPFRVVVVHQHHGERDAEHHDTSDNNLLPMVVVALDVLGVFFVEFLECRSCINLR